MDIDSHKSLANLAERSIMKKYSILFLIILVVLSLVLVSCGGSDNSSSDDSGSSNNSGINDNSGSGSDSSDSDDSSGGEDNNSVCSHTTLTDATIVKEATCTAPGTMGGTCSSCGSYATQSFDAYGHNFVEGFCTVCGETE